MADGYLLGLRAFREVADCKAQALKPLEGAVDVFGAWQNYDVLQYAQASMRKVFREKLIDDCMDTVQAIANLLAAVGATQGDVDAAIRRLDERNGDRGML